MKMTLNEAFAQLIMKQAWYVNSRYSKPQALRDKRFFLSGKAIPEERMREYLRAAGWEQIQQEQWTDPKD